METVLSFQAMNPSLMKPKNFYFNLTFGLSGEQKIIQENLQYSYTLLNSLIIPFWYHLSFLKNASFNICKIILK